jgi:hypothetical protein
MRVWGARYTLGARYLSKKYGTYFPTTRFGLSIRPSSERETQVRNL